MNIKSIRVKKGLSQQQLATHIGVVQTAVSQWECGTTSPSANIIPKIAAALNCTIDELFAQDADECNGGENK